MKSPLVKLDVDHVGSQNPADQPTPEELAALSRYFQEQRRRATEAARQVADAKLQEAGQAV